MRLQIPKSSLAAGYLMVEYLIYIVLLVVVMEIAFSAFYRCLDNSRSLARNTHDILRALRAGETWRTDVREAVGAPRIVPGDGFAAFEIPKSGGKVAYRFGERSVWRTAGEAPPTEILSGVKVSTMVRDERDQVASWRWEVELWTKKKVVHMRPLFTFQAVPAHAPP